MEMIRLFVGHDPREIVAYNVFVDSVVERCSLPLAITPLASKGLSGQFMDYHGDGSNEFIYSRFLVPHLCGYRGWAIFADGDMLCQQDLADLWKLRDHHHAVQVVKHDYRTKHKVKYLGSKNEDYPRKNWSSLILWNCGHPANQVLDPEYVEEATGAHLHRFRWLDDELVGRIPPEWNWLAREYDYNPFAALVHFTLGTPCFRGYESGSYEEEWYKQLAHMQEVPDPAPCYIASLTGKGNTGKRE